MFARLGPEQSAGLSSIIHTNFPVTNIECQTWETWLLAETFHSFLFTILTNINTNILCPLPFSF